MKRKRTTCVIKPSGWKRKLLAKKSKKVQATQNNDSIKSITQLKKLMKVSCKLLTEIWKENMNFTPILNVETELSNKRVSTRPSVREQRLRNRNAYFYKPKRRLIFGKTTVLMLRVI